MNDPEYSLSWPDGVVSSLPGRIWVGDDFVPDDYTPAEVAGGLTSLRFITSAIRRRARLWCVTAVAGLLGGVALSVLVPAPYKAVTSLLLTPGPYENVNTVQNNDQAMAQSRTVASAAVRKLGLTDDPGAFLSSYTAVPLTDRVLQITVSGHSPDQAVARANAVAAAFLQFRAGQMRNQQKLVVTSLDQQIGQVQKQLDVLNSQIGATGNSSGSQPQGGSPRTRRTSLQTLLYNLQQSAIQEQTGVEPQVDASVRGSVVLDAAVPLPHSKVKPLAEDIALGLLVGLMPGIGYVVIAAIVSDRLRRRDDIARALGAPVKLSIPAPSGRWAPRRGRRAVTDADIERVAAYLARIVPDGSGDAAALAVVPVDDVSVPARSLVSLAVSLAREDRNVVVADLCEGAPAAALLGVAEPGVRAVSAQGARLIVAVPDAGEVAPAGPLPDGSFSRGSASGRRSAFTQAVAAACTSACTLLTLVTLDPALGGEHVATWAADAVAAVTAGESSEVRIRAVGELVRLSGTRLVSAVLVGADKSDVSSGVVLVPETA